MKLNTAKRHYAFSIIGLMSAYVGTLIGVVLLFKNNNISGALAYIAGVLPAIPIIGVFYAMGRYLRKESDEYLRMLVVRQSLIATALALSFATAWGFLENFGLVPHLYAYWVAVVWFAGLGLGSCVNRFWR